MARPNILIEGKGHRIFQRLLSDSSSAEIKNVERRRLDDRKIVVKTVKTATTVRYFFTILNTESDESQEFKIKIYSLKLNAANYDITVKVAGITVTDDDVFTIAAFQAAVGEIDILDKSGTLQLGECCLVTLQIFPSSEDIDSEDQDVCRAVGLAPLVDFDDVVKDFEHLATFESLFPTGSTYDNETTVNQFIDNRTNEIVTRHLRQADSIIIDQADIVKRLIINRVRADVTWRAINYAYGTPYELYETLKVLKEEGQILMDEISLDGIVLR